MNFTFRHQCTILPTSTGIVAGDVEDWWRERLPNNPAQLWNKPPAFTSTPLQPGLGVSAHVLQGLSEVDPLATVTSMDCMSAFDLTRGAMLEGLRQVRGGSAAVPVRTSLRQTQYCGRTLQAESSR